MIRDIQTNLTLIQARSQYMQGGLILCNGISIGGCTNLHIIRNGTSLSQRYAGEILILHVIAYIAAIGEFFLLVHANTRRHTDLLVENMLQRLHGS